MIFRFLRSLTRLAHAVYSEPTWSDRGQRVLFVLRCLWNFPYSREWFDYLATDRMAPVAHENPSLYRKPIRPYLCLNWPRRTRISAMMHHYDFLSRWMAPAAFRQIVSVDGYVLLSFPTKNGDELTVRLSYDGKFRKEGETTMDLGSAKHGCRVWSLTFVVAASESGAPCIVIGAVSGLPAGANKDIIKDTAKALFGLRPKTLLLIVLQELARAWKVEALLGVGSRVHVSRHLIYALNHSRRFDITYDQFWQESGGTRRSDGFYVLPLMSRERSPEEIEPHKRALYRNRYALIRDLRSFHPGLN